MTSDHLRGKKRRKKRVEHLGGSIILGCWWTNIEIPLIRRGPTTPVAQAGAPEYQRSTGFGVD